MVKGGVEGGFIHITAPEGEGDCFGKTEKRTRRSDFGVRVGEGIIIVECCSVCTGWGRWRTKGCVLVGYVRTLPGRRRELKEGAEKGQE